MKRLVLFLFFVCISPFLIAQIEGVANLSDDALIFQLNKELETMKNQGATIKDIFDAFVIVNKSYLQTREDYYRFIVHVQWMKGKIRDLQMEEDINPIDDDSPLNAPMLNRNYQDYLDYKATEDAIEQWELSTQDGVLKMLVKNLDKFSVEEQKQYDILYGLLKRDDYFNVLLISDGLNFKEVVYKPNP